MSFQRRKFGLAAIAVILFCGHAMAARAADAAVAYMERVSRDLIAAQRARSPSMFTQAIGRHGDIGGIVMYALGDYRSRLDPADKAIIVQGTTRWLGKYAAQQSPSYQIASVKFQPTSRRAKYGTMVDSTITLDNGSSFEVAWMLIGGSLSTYRVRDAQVVSFWMTPFLKKMFEDYIAERGGQVKALVDIMARH